MTQINYKNLINECLNSDNDFKRNFQKLIYNIQSNNNDDNKLQFIKTLITLLINDAYVLPKRFYAYLILTKVMEYNLKVINEYVINNQEFLNKIDIEFEALWSQYKIDNAFRLQQQQQQLQKQQPQESQHQIQRERSYVYLERVSKNHLRLLAELIVYLNKHYGTNSKKIKSLMDNFIAKRIVLPMTFHIIYKSIDNLDMASTYEIDYYPSDNNDETQAKKDDDNEEEDEEDDEELEITNNPSGEYSHNADISSMSSKVNHNKDGNSPHRDTDRSNYSNLENSPKKTPLTLTLSNEDRGVLRSSSRNKQNNVEEESLENSFRGDGKNENSAKKNPVMRIKLTQNNNRSLNKITEKSFKDQGRVNKSDTKNFNQSTNLLGYSWKNTPDRSRLNGTYTEPYDIYDKFTNKISKDISELKRSIARTTPSPYKHLNNSSTKDKSLVTPDKKTSQLFSPEGGKFALSQKFEKQISELKKQNEAYSKELEDVKRRKDSIKTQNIINEISNMDNEIDDVVKENMRLKDEIMKRSEEYDMAIQENSKLTQNYENIEKENRQKYGYMKELNELRITNEQLVKEAEVLHHENNKLVQTSRESFQIKQKLNELQDKNSMMQTSMNDIISQNSMLMQKIRELEEFQISFMQKQSPKPSRTGLESLEASSQIIPSYKSLKGGIIMDKYPTLDDIKHRVKANSSCIDLNEYKLGCLESRMIVNVNRVLGLNIKEDIYYDEANQRYGTKIIIQYKNKGYTDIENLMIKLTDMDKNIMGLIDNQVDSLLMPNTQSTQTFTFLMKSIPFVAPSLNGTYILNQEMYKFSLILPVNVLRFLNFKPIDAIEFRKKWKLRGHSNNNSLVRSEEIDFDKEILKNSNDLKRYLNNLIDLKPKNEYDYAQGKAFVKYGGIAEFDQVNNLEYLIKITVYPTNKIAFQVGYPEKIPIEIAKFIIKTFVFLFEKQGFFFQHSVFSKIIGIYWHDLNEDRYIIVFDGIQNYQLIESKQRIDPNSNSI